MYKVTVRLVVKLLKARSVYSENLKGTCARGIFLSKLSPLLTGFQIYRCCFLIIGNLSSIIECTKNRINRATNFDVTSNFRVMNGSHLLRQYLQE